MRFHRLFCAAAAAFIAVLPVRADQILGPGRIDNSGNVRLPGGPLLGTMSGNKFTSKPDALQIQGEGSTGAISGMSVTAPGAAAARTLADLVSNAQFNVSTVAALRAWPVAPLTPNAGVRVSGYYAAGDGGGGNLVWSPTSTATDDACVVIKPTAVTGAGRWLRDIVKAGEVNVRACGAVGDAVANDTVPVQTAIRAAEAAVSADFFGPYLPKVKIPAGRYAINGIDLTGAVTLDGDGLNQTSLFLIAYSNRSVIRTAGQPLADPYAQSTSWKQSVSNLSINGNGQYQTAGHGVELTDAPYLLNARYGTGTDLTHVALLNSKQDGLFIGQNRNAGIVNYLVSQLNGRNGITSYGYDWNFVSGGVGQNGGSGLAYEAAGQANFTNFAFFTHTAGFGAKISQFVNSSINFWGCAFDQSGLAGLSIDSTVNDQIPHIGIFGGRFFDNSTTASGTYSHISINNSRNVTVSGVLFSRTANSPNTKYLVDQTGALGTLNWYGNSWEHVDAASIPYAVAPFARPSQVTGMYSTGTNTAPNNTLEAPTIIRSGSVQFPTALTLQPPTHATSRRTALSIDDWQWLQDFSGNGSKDFGLYQNSQGQTRMYFDTGGNIGVGTMVPGAKLDVVGTMRGQMLVLSAAPTVTNLPASYWTVVKRTDDGSVKMCANDNGTIKCAVMN